MGRLVASLSRFSALSLRNREESAKARNSRILQYLCAFLLMSFAASNAQSGQAPGILPFSTRNFNIDLASSSITAIFPIRSKDGKIPVSYSLVANYQIGLSQDGTTLTFPLGTFAGQLNAHTFGYAVESTIKTTDNCNGFNEWVYAGWVVIDGTGASHPLPYFEVDATGNCFSFPPVSTTQDGSGLTVVSPGRGNLGTRTVYDAAGYGFTTGSNTLTDPDGATVVQSGNGVANFTDSLGTLFMSQTYSGSNIGGLVYPNANGNNINPPYAIAYQSFNVRTNFNCQALGYHGADSSSISPVSLPVSITDPTGAVTRLTYEPTPGYTGYITGRLASITYGTGGSLSYAYSQNGDPRGQNGFDCVSFVTPKITITVNDNNGAQTVWTYANYNSNSISTPGNFKVIATDPAGNQTAYNFFGEYQTQAAVYEGGCPTSISGCNGGGTLLTTTTTCYDANFSTCATPAYINPNSIYQTDAYTSSNGSASTLAETMYDSYGNITEAKHYGYGVATPPTGNPLADTTITHAGVNGVSCGSVAPYQYDRTCSITTSNLSGSAMNQVSQVNYTYTNGHPTQTSAWVSGSTFLHASATYNSNGTVNTSTDVSGTVSTYAYNGTGGCSSFLPTSVTVGGLTTSTQWNCYGGVPTQTTDYNQKTTTYAYNDPLWRVSSVTDPLINVTNVIYKTNSVERIFNFNSSSQDTITTVDGLGRTIRTQTKHGSAYDTVTTKYNAVADTVSVSIPCSASLGGDCTTGFTVVTNDAVGRTSSIVDGGGAMLATTFSAQDTISTLSPHPGTENNKIVQSEIDGLGRTTSICSILASGGTSCGQVAGNSGIATAFAYSSAPGSTTVTATRGVQTRNTVKDALGRVTSQTDPESGTKQYVYDYYAPGTGCGYTTLPGRLIVVILQGNNREKCFDYDSIGRMTDEGENISGGAAFCTRFRFDTSTSGNLFPAPGTILNGVGRIVEAETDNCTYPPTAATMFSDEWFSYDAVGNVTDVWEKTSHSGGYYHSTATYFANGQMSSLGIPAVGTINYTLDADGRWYSAKIGTLNLISSVTYGPTGVGTVNIGSGTDKDVYTYSPATGLMTSYQLTGGSKTVTGTLNWNANRTLGSLQIVDGWNTADNETCTFIYDDLSRLTSDQCGSIWAQTYSYGIYDNLNQFGNDPFTFTYNAANNHYSTSGVTYDADGNLTYDGVNNYTYNASDRLWSAIPSGSGNTCANDGWASCITYDAFGHSIEIYQGGTYYQRVYGPAGKTVGMQGQTLSYAYVPLPGGSRALYWAGAYDYTHVDWLGSGRLATSIPTSGNGVLYYDRQFSPFGEMYGNSWPTIYSQSFTGDTPDTFVGLLDTPNRELNQSQGRWLTPDPAHSGWNLYAYTTNPNSFTDPSGLCPPPGCGGTSTPGGFSSPSTTCDPGQRNCYNPGDCNATIDGGSLCFNPVGNVFDWMSIPTSSSIGVLRCKNGDCGYSTAGNGAYSLCYYALANPCGGIAANNDSWAWAFTKSFFTFAGGPGNKPTCAGQTLRAIASELTGGFIGSQAAETSLKGASVYQAGRALNYAANQTNTLGGIGLICPQCSSVFRSMMTKAEVLGELSEVVPLVETSVAAGNSIPEVTAQARNGECSAAVPVF